MNFYKYHQGITIYPETPRRGSIVHPTHYEPLRDELVQYGREILPMHSFFDQLNILFQRTPKIAIRHFPPADNAEYCEGVGRGAKNCYLSVGACIDTEDVFYSLEVKEQCSAVFDSIMVWDSCTQIYQSNAVFRSYQVFYSSLITNSYDIRFSSNLTGCSECILCHDLQNQHYCIQNTPYTKDVYMQKKQEILSQKHKFLSMKQELTVVPTTLSHACVGNMVIECENVEDAWYAYRVRNSKNIFLAGTAQGNQEMINVSTSGAPDFEHICNVINGGGGHHIYYTN